MRAAGCWREGRGRGRGKEGERKGEEGVGEEEAREGKKENKGQWKGIGRGRGGGRRKNVGGVEEEEATGVRAWGSERQRGITSVVRRPRHWNCCGNCCVL